MMKKISFALLGLVVVTSNAVELTMDTWDDYTAGKSIFVKFLAPWCGHCKKMKPAWDELMEAFADSPHYLIADVDCTADGKSLCASQGVRGYPTIKYGNPANLQTYKGGRDFDTLKKFVDENLKPLCSPLNLDVCDDASKADIKKFQEMDTAALDAAIASAEKELRDEEKRHRAEVMALENKFAEFKKDKASGIGLMKTVKIASKNKADDTSKEEL